MFRQKQISFRVSESEYLNLERSAKVLNISVAKVVGAWNGSLSGWYQAWQGVLMNRVAELLRLCCKVLNKLVKRIFFH